MDFRKITIKNKILENDKLDFVFTDLDCYPFTLAIEMKDRTSANL